MSVISSSSASATPKAQPADPPQHPKPPALLPCQAFQFLHVRVLIVLPIHPCCIYAQVFHMDSPNLVIGIECAQIESLCSVPSQMRTKGKITSWNDEKGFGFITPDIGGKEVFIHIKAFVNRSRRPKINQVVTYALSFDKQGRTRAVKATLPGDRIAEKTQGKHGSLPTTAATFFLFIVGISVLTAKIPLLVLGFYLVASLLTFITYALDKSAAKKGAWRTKESTLHLLSLAGGWPGALIAQQKLRHKSKKQSFRLVFWVTVLLNCGVFVWLFTAAGAAALKSLLGGAV